LHYLNSLVVKVFLIIVVSYNQPRFCPSATWNSTALTFANVSTVGVHPYGIFVNINDSVYVNNQQQSQIIVWFKGDINSTIINATKSSSPLSIFVTITNDIYIDSSDGGIHTWKLNPIQELFTLNTSTRCLDIFISSNNVLYCSLSAIHIVIKISLDNNDTQIITVAGTGSNGSTSLMLNSPRGILLDINSNLYVADYGNNRIQFFRTGQLNATTIAGNGAPGTIDLFYPIDIVFDGDGYLFITDSANHRIVGSDINGYRCIVGCFGNGSSPDKLSSPHGLAFDSYGNIFVTDYFNNRIQKFFLATNSCS